MENNLSALFGELQQVQCIVDECKNYQIVLKYQYTPPFDEKKKRLKYNQSWHDALITKFCFFGGEKYLTLKTIIYNSQ